MLSNDWVIALTRLRGPWLADEAGRDKSEGGGGKAANGEGPECTCIDRFAAALQPGATPNQAPGAGLSKAAGPPPGPALRKGRAPFQRTLPKTHPIPLFSPPSLDHTPTPLRVLAFQ